MPSVLPSGRVKAWEDDKKTVKDRKRAERSILLGLVETEISMDVRTEAVSISWNQVKPQKPLTRIQTTFGRANV